MSTAGWLLKFSNKPSQKSPLYSSAISQLGCPIENNFPPQSFVDVNDLALLFYSVLVTPSLEKNERIFASTSSFSWNDILRVLYELNPELSKTSLRYLTGERDRVDHTVIDNGRFLELLEIKGSRANCLYTSVSNTMKGWYFFLSVNTINVYTLRVSFLSLSLPTSIVLHATILLWSSAPFLLESTLPNIRALAHLSPKQENSPSL